MILTSKKVTDRITFKDFTGTLEFQNAEGNNPKILSIDEKTSISSCSDIYDDPSVTCNVDSNKYEISKVKVRFLSQDSLKVSLPQNADFIIENQSLKGRVLEINLFNPT